VQRAQLNNEEATRETAFNNSSLEIFNLSLAPIPTLQFIPSLLVDDKKMHDEKRTCTVSATVGQWKKKKKEMM
jgi:hypothetical protein